MRGSLARRALWLAAMMAAPMQASAATEKPWETVPLEIRQSARPLDMVVHIKQEDLRVGRDPGDQDTPDSLMAVLIVGGIDSISRGGAEKTIGPLRDVLDGKQAEETFMAAIRDGVGSIPWIKLRAGPALRDNSDEAKRALLAQADGRYLLDADCSYNMSQRYQAVYASCAVLIAEKDQGDTAKKRETWGDFRYARFVEAEVALSNPASGIQGRREQWAADSSALLRSSLYHALRKAGMLVGRQLQLTEADLLAAKTMPKQRFVTAYVGMAYEHSGRVIEGADNVVGKHHPNAGGLMLLYKPGADGVTLLEGRDLYYNFAVEGPAVADD